MQNNDVKKADMLSLLSPERLTSARPFSNPCEYLFPDRDELISYLTVRGVEIPERGMSDFEFFNLMWSAISKDKSFVARRKREAINKFLGSDVNNLESTAVWTVAVDILENKRADELFAFSIPEIGIAVKNHQRKISIPPRLGEAVAVPVLCPFGTSHFDIDSFDYKVSYSNIESIFSEYQRISIFIGGFEFEEPNDYLANKAYEKKASGVNLSDKERSILSSQLCRRIINHCVKESKDLLLFLPNAPDVYSMGQLSRFLNYADEFVSKGKLASTIFASDAVGMCFLSSLIGRGYKKITTAAGVSGNGCGIPDSDSAEYWGISEFPIKRASLSMTPAFIED